MSYDTLRDVDDQTIAGIIEHYKNVDDTVDKSDGFAQIKAEIVEALNQFGSQTMDDTVKRDGMWALARALAIIESMDGNSGGEFSLEKFTETLSTSGGQTRVREFELSELVVDSEPLESVVAERRKRLVEPRK